MTAKTKTITIYLCASLVSGCGGYYNISGANQAKAQAEAERFVASDPALSGSEVECKKHDSDGDGDVTCTVFAPSGDRVTLECPTRRFMRFLEDEGCREVLRLGGKVGGR